MVEDPFSAPREGFIPAEVGDVAAFERAPNRWVWGIVTQVCKNPPRVRKLRDSTGMEHTVGPRHHIRVGPARKLDMDMVGVALREEPPIFSQWKQVAAVVVACLRRQDDGADRTAAKS
jgi:hypothetical protein